MLPRSQQEQISTCSKQHAQRNRRAVASACLPSSHRRGRGPPPVGYCPGIRASARCGARRRCELPGCYRRRACLQQRQTLSPPPSPFGVAAPRSAYRRSDQRAPARKGALQRQMASNSGLLDQREPSVTATDRHDITIDGPWRQLCAGPQNRRQTALLAVSAHGLLAPTTRS